jgi:hypothetical protein
VTLSIKRSKLHDVLVGVDAGTHGVGISLWNLLDPFNFICAGYVEIDHARLDRARRDVEGWLRQTGMSIYDHLRARLLVEQMKVLLPEDGGKTDPKHLIRVSHVVGAVASLFTLVDFAEPGEWKGSKSKKVTTNINGRDLDPEEKLRIHYPKQRKTLGHNVDDAVAIGLAGVKALGYRKARVPRYTPSHHDWTAPKDR